jgi:hypothetical protein
MHPVRLSFLHLADPAAEDIEEPPAILFGPGPELDGSPEREWYPAEGSKVLFVLFGDPCREKRCPGTFRLDKEQMFMRPPGDQVRQVRLGALDHVIPPRPEQVTGHELDFPSPGTAGRCQRISSLRMRCAYRAVR